VLDPITRNVEGDDCLGDAAALEHQTGLAVDLAQQERQVGRQPGDIAAPETGDAAGSGQVGLGDDFAFQAKANKKGAPTGDAVHVFVSGSTAYVVSAATLTSLTRTCTGGNPKICSATVQAGGASVTAIDLTTGVATAVPGTASIRVDATDDTTDRYAVSITGAVTYSLGTPGSQVSLTAGEVRIPS